MEAVLKGEIETPEGEAEGRGGGERGGEGGGGGNSVNSHAERLAPSIKEQIEATIGTQANYVVLQYRENKPTSLTSSRTVFSYGMKKTDLLEFQVRVGEAKVASLQLSVKFVPNEEAYPDSLVTFSLWLLFDSTRICGRLGASARRDAAANHPFGPVL